MPSAVSASEPARPRPGVLRQPVTDEQRDAYFAWISPYLDANELALVARR